MDEWQRRVELLEQEMMNMKQEMALLKEENKKIHQEAMSTHKKKVQYKPFNVNLNKEEQKSAAKESLDVPTERTEQLLKHLTENSDKDQKPAKSFEERLLSVLPKVFMFLIVLGVLWGLKVASDYGYFGDSVKIISAYALSVGLIGLAFYFERANKSVRTVRLAMYGGAFLIGILTTAAAVLLYELFSTNVALVIAIIYIVYGVWISYKKAAQGLTVFVMAVSLLLPYLLEYMASPKIVVVGFITLLFICMQWITLKHKQRIAQIITGIFAAIAMLTLHEWLDSSNSVTFISWIILIGVSLFVWLQLVGDAKRKGIYTGLAYSITVMGYGLFVLLQTIGEVNLMYSLLLFIVMVALSYVAWRKKEAFDVLCALTILTWVIVVYRLNIDPDWRLLLAMLAFGMGVYLGLKPDRQYMRYTNTTFLIGITAVVYTSVSLITTVDWLLHILPVIIGISLVVIMVKQVMMFKYIDWVRGATYILAVWFVWKIEDRLTTSIIEDYTIMRAFPIVFISFVSVMSIIWLVAPKKVSGRALPFVGIVILFVTSLGMLGYFRSYIDGLQTPFSYFIVIIAWGIILYFIIKDRFIPELLMKDWQKWKEQLIVTVSIFTTVILWKWSKIIELGNHIDQSTYVISTSVWLFALAIFLLSIGRQHYKMALRVGIAVLFIALTKLIFYDLSSLNLLIRAIFFIIIGALGLVVTNKLLKVQTKDEE